MRAIVLKPEMVTALQEGRKTQVRLPIDRARPNWEFKSLDYGSYRTCITPNGEEYPVLVKGLSATFHWDGRPEYPLIKTPCDPGDALYIREQWARLSDITAVDPELGLPDGYLYRADWPEDAEEEPDWRAAGGMPQEAARLFVRVTDIRVKRLRDMTEEDALAEGVPSGGERMPSAFCPTCKGRRKLKVIDTEARAYKLIPCPDCQTACQRFRTMWERSMRVRTKAKFGWTANPWVWAFSIEKISREEAVRAGLVIGRAKQVSV